MHIKPCNFVKKSRHHAAEHSRCGTPDFPELRSDSRDAAGARFPRGAGRQSRSYVPVPRKGGEPEPKPIKLVWSAEGEMSKPVIKQQTISSRLDRNIAALLERRRQEAATATLQEKAAAAITRFAGSMIFVYIHALVFGGWIVINVGLLPILPAFDPSMVVLAMVASVEAIFISTFVMISQNRMAEADDKRADLNLQISLLAEHETTQLLSILTAIAEKLGLDLAQKQEIAELQEDVTPEGVLDTIDKISGGANGRSEGRGPEGNV